MSSHTDYLLDKLETTQESLRQAVASIDRLTAERAPMFVVPPQALRDLPGVTASPSKQHSASQYRIDELQNEVASVKASLATMTEFRNGALKALNSALVRADELQEKVDTLSTENNALRQEIVALKARTLAAPNDQEDMAILGRFFKRLVAHDRVRVSLEKIATASRSWARVEPERHWSCNRYPADSRLGQILLGLTK